MWRTADPSDDEVIVAMCLSLNAEDPGPATVGGDQVLRTLRTLRAEPIRGRAIVLEVEGQPRGYALLISFWSNELGGEVCIIDELYVMQEARGRGYATCLFDEMTRAGGLCPGRPIALALEVTPANARARAFYERLGFKGKNLVMNRRLHP